MKMRRFWSITTILALVAAMLAPMTGAAMEAAHPMGCPRTAAHSEHQKSHAMKAHAHHCGAMHEEHAPEPASPGSSISGLEKSCPMDCCVQGSLPNASAVAAFSLILQLAVSDAELHLVPIIFVSAGFSSHTDRGPPTA
ncbi:MAG TPA: hypothetical protein VF532_21830 [Candidatus Angelobacter sp.]